LLHAQETPPVKKIADITFNGIIVTKESTLRMFLANAGVDTGVSFDSLRIAEATYMLKATGLYSSVKILATPQNSGIHLSVIVQEIFYYQPGGNLERFQTTYDDRSWWKLSAGLTKLNFRGRMETVHIRTSFWEDRALSLTWIKPLLPSNFSIGIGAGIHDYPELNYARTRETVVGRLLFMNNITAHSRAFLNVIPIATRIDSTGTTIHRQLNEGLIAAGWQTDYRDNTFDPFEGWYIYNEFLTNQAYANDNVYYGQFSTDFRCYFPGFLRNNRFACRLTAALRSNDGGQYRRMYTGGSGSVRGYMRDYLGVFDDMNNCITASAEYRFPIFTGPAMDLPIISDMSASLKGFTVRLDGALIADAGHLWHEFGTPLSRFQNGAGFGAGVKMLFPALSRSLCFDVVSPLSKDAGTGKATFYSPEYHLYIDAAY
jgi:outer membrane protein assembly factor BamA